MHFAYCLFGVRPVSVRFNGEKTRIRPAMGRGRAKGPS